MLNLDHIHRIEKRKGLTFISGEIKVRIINYMTIFSKKISIILIFTLYNIIV